MERSLRSRPEGKKAVGPSVATFLRSGGEIFARDARAWGLTPGHALMIAIFPIVATLVFIATVPFPGLFLWVVDEDSLLETLQFVLILATSLLLAWLSGRLIRTGRRGIGTLYVLLTLGTFFVAGEEISWGQRLFGWRTPEALEAINAQQEISLHNIYGFHQPFIYAVMLGGMYGAVVPLVGLALSADRRRSTLSYLLIPPLCLVPAFFLPFGYRFCRLVLRPELYVAPGYKVFVITELNELTELSLYFGLLVFAWLNLRRLRLLGSDRVTQSLGTKSL
jgi:hypothetical protein